MALLVDFAEQPCILDSDFGLAGERRKEVNDPLFKFTRRSAHQDDSSYCVIACHGNSQHRSESRIQHEISIRMILSTRHVGDLDRLPGFGSLPDTCLAQINRRLSNRGKKLCTEIVACNHVESLTRLVEFEDPAT